MRTSQTFLSAAAVAALALLAATGALAQTAPPPTCTNGFGVTFTVSSGPNFVDCDGNPGGPQCTEIEYRVSGTNNDVYALQGLGVVSVTPAGQIAAACNGIGSFGKGSCHEQAIKTRPDSFGKLKITLTGFRNASPTSLATGPGNDQKACRIQGIGLEDGPNAAQTSQKSEIITFKGCKTEFTRDPWTNDVTRVRMLTTTGDGGKLCKSPTLLSPPGLNPNDGIIAPRPAGEVQVTLGGLHLGRGKVGSGLYSSGKDSCTTYVIGGVVYTWGTDPCPCPDENPDCE